MVSKAMENSSEKVEKKSVEKGEETTKVEEGKANEKIQPDEKGDEEDKSSSTWQYLKDAEMVQVLFFERPHELLAYSMEIIWKDPTGYRFDGVDCHAYDESRGVRTRDKYIPRLQEAAAEAKNMKKLEILYYNPPDRAWPYSTVPMVLDAFTSVNGKHAMVDNVKESDEGLEYSVTFSESKKKKKKKKNKKRKRNGSYEFKMDCSVIDPYTSGTLDELGLQ